MRAVDRLRTWVSVQGSGPDRRCQCLTSCPWEARCRFGIVGAWGAQLRRFDSVRASGLLAGARCTWGARCRFDLMSKWAARD